MPNTLAKRITFGLLSPILATLLIGQLSVPVHAQTEPQVLPAPAPKRVLLLYTYGDGLPGYQKATPAFLSVTTAAAININDLFFEYLDLQRNDNAEYRQKLADLLRYKYAKRQVGLIVTVHTAALNFLLDEAKGLFPDAPIFSYLIVRPELIEAKNTGRRILLRPQSLDWGGTLAIALKMFPQTRKIVFVTGTASGDRNLEHEAKRAFEPWRNKLEFQYTSDRSVEEMLQLVASLPPQSIVIYNNVFSDKTDRTFIPREVGKMVAKAANAPVFCLWDTLIGSGVIGGSLLSFEAEGTYAANVVLDVLNGKMLLTKPVTTLPTSKTYMFDCQQLKRWGVNESILPEGSVLVNRVPTMWEQHKGLIIVGIAAFLAQTMLVIGLLVQRNLKKKAESSVRQKTEELDQFFNVTLDLLCIANTDGYFLRVNPAAERVLGYTREELIAKRFLDFVHPDDVNSTLKVITTLASQQKVLSFENRYRCKDGTYRWLEWSSAPAGNLIYAAARDVTERKLAAEALEERLGFERLVSNISAGFVNIPPDRVDSEIEQALKQILDFFKVDRCALLQLLPDKTSWQITHVSAQENVPPVPQGTKLPVSINPWAYDKLIRKQEVLSVSRLDDLPAEANVDKQTWIGWGIRSNLNIPIIIGGPVDHIFAINSVKSERGWPEELIPRLRLLGEILVNALERKQIRLEIEERLRFEGLVSNLSAGFVNLPLDDVESQVNEGLRSITEFFDADRCSIGLFSDNGSQLALGFEYRLAEAEPAPESISKEQMPWYVEQLIQGKPVVMNRVEDLPPEAEKERLLCLAKGMKSFISIPMLSGGKTLGSCALVSTRAERVWPEELVKRFRLVTGVFANVLERKRAEAEAFQARRELLQLDRLSRMGELTASLAHELNQPLAAILNNAQAGLRFLQSGKIDLDEFREILQDIAQDDQRAGNVIRGLRSMVKREEVHRDLIILNDVLNEVIQIFHTESIFRNVHVETELDGSLPPVLGDKVQLQQVVLNLILNAADAMSDNPPGHRQIILRTGVKDDRIRVTVRDFGPGIDKANLERMFEAFFTTKGAGLGMGLAVCRTIVEAHGGHIWAENNPDRGATFVFELPIKSNE